jgi:hypothetical protein
MPLSFRYVRTCAFVDRQKSFDGFRFNNKSFAHEVEPVTTVKETALVADGLLHLAPKRESSERKLMGEARFVGRLEETWAEVAMHFNARADYAF